VNQLSQGLTHGYQSSEISTSLEEMETAALTNAKGPGKTTDNQRHSGGSLFI
jgi:hypothetical protein